MKRIALMLLVVFLSPLLCFAQRGKVKDFETNAPAPETFLRPLKTVGRFSGGYIFLVTNVADCLDENGVMLPNCYGVPSDASQPVAWNQIAIDTLVIPAKALHDLLVVEVQHTPSYNLYNSTNENQYGLFHSQVTLTIESPAFLNGTDPNTGLPLNGAWTIGGNPRHLSMRLLAGDSFSETFSYSRRIYLSRSLIKNNTSLTDAQVDQLFDNPITLRMNMIGRARCASDSTIFAFYLVEGY